MSHVLPFCDLVRGRSPAQTATRACPGNIPAFTHGDTTTTAERGLDTAQVQEYPRFYAARVPHVPFRQGNELFHGPAYFLSRLVSLLPWGFVTCVDSLEFTVELLFPPILVLCPCSWMHFRTW